RAADPGHAPDYGEGRTARARRAGRRSGRGARQSRHPVARRRSCGRQPGRRGARGDLSRRWPEHARGACARGAGAWSAAEPACAYRAVRASYGSYYRRMMPRLLAALEFRSNNGAHRPLLDALHAIRRAEGDGRQYFQAAEVAIEGVIRPKWRDIVIEDAPDGGQRINRINYEVCVLQTLRERLRCKEIWVAGADRFRNPDEDLPADFADRRAACYERLGLPMQAGDFVQGLRAELADAL